MTEPSSKGLIVAGKRVPVPGVSVVTWQDDPKRAPRTTDGKARDPDDVCAIVVHTSKGSRCKVREGSRPSTMAERLALYQSRTTRDVSWPVTVDSDGDVLQQCDAVSHLAWHCGSANGWTIGIELVQHEDSPDLYTVQINAAVSTVVALCDAHGIPKRVIVNADGTPRVTPVKSLLSPRAKDRAGKLLGGKGQQFEGVIGHCHLVPDHVRGPGDPGPHVFAALLLAGFERVVLP